MSEFQRIEKIFFRQLRGTTFDHEHVGFCTDVDEIEIGRVLLFEGWVGDEFAIDTSNANGADWTIPRNVGDCQCSRSSVEHGDIRLVGLVRREKESDDLNFVQKTLWKERATRTVTKT